MTCERRQQEVLTQLSCRMPFGKSNSENDNLGPVFLRPCGNAQSMRVEPRGPMTVVESHVVTVAALIGFIPSGPLLDPVKIWETTSRRRVLMTVTEDTTERSAQRPTAEPSSGPGTTTQAMKDAVKRPTTFPTASPTGCPRRWGDPSTSPSGSLLVVNLDVDLFHGEPKAVQAGAGSRAWFTSQFSVLPLNLITTVAELFIGFLVATAANRSQNTLTTLLDKIDMQEEQIEATETNIVTLIKENTEYTSEIHSLTTEIRTAARCRC